MRVSRRRERSPVVRRLRQPYLIGLKRLAFRRSPAARQILSSTAGIAPQRNSFMTPSLLLLSSFPPPAMQLHQFEEPVALRRVAERRADGGTGKPSQLHRWRASRYPGRRCSARSPAPGARPIRHARGCPPSGAQRSPEQPLPRTAARYRRPFAAPRHGQPSMSFPSRSTRAPREVRA